MNDVIILFGGTSGERRVSVASAQNVATRLAGAELWFWSTSGEVHQVDADELARFDRPFENDFTPKRPSSGTLAKALDATTKTFFLALHGGTGEDGTVQKLLEARKLGFTGSDSTASARAFDKVAAKNIVRLKGVKVADSVVLPQRAPDAAKAALGDLFKKHGRVVVKPVADGSSVGLHHVRTAEDVVRVAAAVSGDSERAYLAEAFLRGREMTCGVVESNGKTRALPPSEVIMDEGRAFDFEGKYLGKGTREVTPAEAPPEILRAVQQLVITAHEALGCRGYTRTDVIVTDAGPCFLETNTLPGMTKASFIPQQLAAEGTDVTKFLREQLEIARTRYR